MNGDAASNYAARRLQLAAAGSSPKALLAAVVTTAHIRLLLKMVMLVFRGWPAESDSFLVPGFGRLRLKTE